jgi:DNA-directed RNA polymerase specialized sigma24 family protein
MSEPSGAAGPESSGRGGPGSDAELLNRIRSGDPTCYGVLRARHAAAARDLAGLLVSGPAAADELADGAFAGVLDAIVRGGGPSDAFRPYLLAAVRRQASGGAAPVPVDEQQIPDPGQPQPDPAASPADAAAIAAFLSLPERWRAVLWHLDIEAAAPASVAALLGLSAAGVAELAARARDGLARAQAQIHPANDTSADQVAVLRGAVAPVFLGAAASDYLARFAGAPGGPGGAAPAGAGVLAGFAAPAWLAGKLRGSSRQQRAIAAGAGVLAAIFVVGIYVLALGSSGGTVSVTAHRSPVRAAAPPTSPAASPAPTRPTASRSADPASQHRAAGGTGPTTATPLPSTPAPTSPSPSPVTAQVSAQINVFGPGGYGDVAGVAFGVADSGPAATETLTASISLPAGTALVTSQQGPSSSSPDATSRNAETADVNGWSCQAVGGGAACVHGAISATAQAGGMIAIQVTGSAACGQHVTVTVTGGTSPATAQSAGTIQCDSGHGPGHGPDPGHGPGHGRWPGHGWGGHGGHGARDTAGPAQRY